MSVKKIEIQGHGALEVKHDYLHRGNRPRLVTYDKDRFKEVQFDSYEENPLKHNQWQLGWDYNGDEIKIKVTQE